MLRELDNVKTEFISIASHQLRTPLTAIKGYLSLLLEGSYGNIPEALREVIGSMTIASNRVINLVENLLDVSRIESGRMQYEFAEIPLEPILKGSYDSLILAAKSKHLSLTLNLPETPLPKLSLDTQKMQEVFSNLIENAIKYTQEGGVTVAANQTDEGKVHVTVTDTGIGIPTSEIPNLFVKFSRGKDVNRLHANGTGLGLYVVKNIVEAHKGKVWIESAGEGRGTTFVVELG